MKWLSRETFSERRFPSWTAWFKRICVYAWIAGFLSELFAKPVELALFDTVKVLILWPLFAILLIWLLALACMRLWRVSFPAALAGLSEYLFLLFCLPLLDLGLKSLGYDVSAGFANGWQALASILSGGLLPFSVAPPSFTMVWLGILLWITLSARRSLSSTASWQKIILSILPTYLGFSLLFLIPSLIGWSVVLREVSIWSVPDSLVERAFVASQIDGYAWQHVYERFPLGIGGEAQLSQLWLFGVLSWMIVMGVSIGYVTRVWRWNGKTWRQFANTSFATHGLISLLIGMIAAYSLETNVLHGMTGVLAVCLLFVSVVLLAFAQSAEQDLKRAVQGSLSSERSLAAGQVRAVDLEDWRVVWLIGGLIGGFLLGWQVFLAFVWIQLVSILPERFAGPLANFGYVLAGWMVIVAQGSFGSLAPAIAALVCLAFFALSHLKSRASYTSSR